MKIGLMTHHYVKNYGAYLQAQALWQALERLFPDAQVRFVDFRVPKHTAIALYRRLWPRRGEDTPRNYRARVRQALILGRYERALPRTRRVAGARGIRALGLDALVVGSDEVWDFTDYGGHPLKLGAGLHGLRLISYAACCGKVGEDTPLPPDVVRGLANFRSLAVRDDATQAMVRRALGREAVRTLDPTLLVCFDTASGRRMDALPRDGYLLLYQLRLSPEQAKAVCEWARAHSLLVVGAGEGKRYYDACMIDVTPMEWVRLFERAACVLTGTFHGTVFAIKYQKPFVSAPAFANRISKVSSLLRELGLEERLLVDWDAASLKRTMEGPIDYPAVERVLEQRRAQSLEYLKRALEADEEDARVQGHRADEHL